MDKFKVINILRYGNEIEALNAIRSLKTLQIDNDLFKAISFNYLFSEIKSVSKACGSFLGKNGRLKAHALYFRGKIH